MNSINVAVFVLLAASVSAGTLKTPLQDCSFICPQIYMPICASNGNEARIFSSDCHMKMTNCKNVLGKSDVFTPREMDLCASTNKVKTFIELKECPQMCPKIYDPVCASNGNEARLFHSECHMKMTNCKNISGKTDVFTPREMDQCVSTNMVKGSSEPQECPQMCPKLFDPVCASNGKEAKLFYSECHMNMMNCNLKTGENDLFTPRETELCEQVDTIKALAGSSISNISKTISILNKTKCIRPCPMIYRPVCATHGQESKVFGSECLMDQHNCLTSEKWMMTRTENC